MTHTEEFIEPQANQPVPDRQRLPWEREKGWLLGFFSTCFMIVFSPKRAYSLCPAGAYYKPWLFVWLVGLPGLFATTHFDPMLFKPAGVNASPDTLSIIGETLILSTIGLATLAVVGLINHSFLKSKVSNPAPLWATYRALAYSSAVNLFSLPLEHLSAAAASNDPNSPEVTLLTLPSMIIWVYGIYLQCIGLAAMHNCNLKTALISILKTALVLIPVVLIIGLSIAKITGAFDN